MKKLLQIVLVVIFGIVFFSLGMKYEERWGNSVKRIQKAQEDKMIAEANSLLWFFTLKKAFVRGGVEAARSSIDELQDRTVVTIWNLASSSSEETKAEIKQRFVCALPVPGWQSTLPQSEDKSKLRKEAETILEIVRKEHEKKVLLAKQKYAEQNALSKPQRKAVLRSNLTNDTTTITNTVVVP